LRLLDQLAPGELKLETVGATSSKLVTHPESAAYHAAQPTPTGS
jgi:hypothetical protein